MTVRNPLVLVPGGNPQIQELPAGDTIGGAPQGPQGVAATISVGTVTTGAAGSSASVTNSGTSGAAVFDFTIPRGDTGATGSAGQGVPVGGTAGQVLSKVDATDYNTHWVNSGGGSYVLLQSHTASASATLDFTGFISSSYDVYVFEFMNIVPATAAVNFQMRVGTGAGPTWDSGSNYNYAEFVSTTGAGTAQASSAGTTAIVLMNNLSTAANKSSIGHVKLYTPSNTSYEKAVSYQTYHAQNGGGSTQLVGGGAYLSTTAVTGVRFLMSSGNITAGTIRVYGITNA